MCRMSELTSDVIISGTWGAVRLCWAAFLMRSAGTSSGVGPQFQHLQATKDPKLHAFFRVLVLKVDH